MFPPRHISLIGDIPIANVTVPALTTMTTKSFRFLDLPQELQDHIYRHHLQVVSITITDNRYDE